MADDIKSAFDVAFRDYVTEGIPSSGKNKVKKSEVRGIGPILQERIDGHDEDIADMDQKVNTLVSSQGKGSIGSDTLTNLTALAVTIGLNNSTDIGKLGEVFGDPDSTKDGVYTWDGTDWDFQGLGRLGKLEAATGAPVITPGYPFEWDRMGIIGPAFTMYVPRNLTVSVGNTEINADFGSASSARPTHIALTLVNSTNQQVVYIDLDDETTPIKTAIYTDFPDQTRPDKVFILAIVRRLEVVWSVCKVISLTDNTKTRIALRYPIVSEKDEILIPSYYAITSTGAVLHSPADGSLYWGIPRNTSSGNDRRILHDTVIAAAGGTPVRYVDSTAAPRVPSDYLVSEIASVMTREMKTQFASVGYVEGGLVPNQFPLGKYPDLAQRYTQASTTVVDVTDADLIALGFTRGVSGVSAIYGGSAPADAPEQGYVFARLYVQAVTDDTWGTPTLYIRDKFDVLSSVPLVLEKRISAKAAIFNFFTQYDYSADGDRPNHVWMGLMSNAAGNIVTGAQFYLGSGARGWIARDDWPMDRRGDVLYPETLYTIEGRELPLVPSAIVADRDTQGGRPLFALFSSGNNVPMLKASRDLLELDYSKVVDGSTMVLSAPGTGTDRGRRFTRSVGVVRKATPIAATPKILAIGDSITLRGTVPAMNSKLVAMGLTPTWMGTIKMQVDAGTYASLYAEGRSGWAFGDFIYEIIAQPPVAIGGEAAYLARASEGTYGATRHEYNPFVRDTVEGDDPEFVRNGKIFDFRFFVDRFEGLYPNFNGVDPDVVLIGLGTNDINEEDIETAFARVTGGWTIMINQARAAFPSAKVGVWIPAPPYGMLSQQRWQLLYVPLLKWLLAYIDTLADADIEAIGVWGHMTPSASYSLAMTTTVGGLTEGWVVDELHPCPASSGENYNRQAIAEVLAQWIACREA